MPEENRLKKVAEMIRKTFHNKDQTDCFDGCTLYVEEHCAVVRAEYTRDVSNKFREVKEILEDVRDDVRAIKTDLGLNGNNKG